MDKCKISKLFYMCWCWSQVMSDRLSVWFALATMESVWLYQVRTSVKILVGYWGVKECKDDVCVMWRECKLWHVKVTTVRLFTLRGTCHVWYHAHILDESSCRVSSLLAEHIVRQTTQLPANRQIYDETLSGRSLMYTKKRMNTDPWGMPDVTDIGDDDWSLQHTYSEWLERKLHSQLYTLLSRLRLASFRRSRSWGTLLKHVFCFLLELWLNGILY